MTTTKTSPAPITTESARAYAAVRAALAPVKRPVLLVGRP